MTQRRYRYRDHIDWLERRKNRPKSSVRARVEHPFFVLKRVFGFAKVRYRGIAKNAERLYVACALVNIFQLRRPLVPTGEGLVPGRVAMRIEIDADAPLDARETFCLQCTACSAGS
jgi:hypothetical protein